MSIRVEQPGVETTPILRIESVQHTTGITRLDVDREGRFLVTGSEDKTVRVWQVPDGRLLRVLRPPIGPGHEGKVYAVAISPDGVTVAVAGWMSPSGTDEVVYLFDRETWRISRLLGGLQGVVNSLCFSPQGDCLAATLSGGYGLRIWRTQDWSEFFGDEEYDGDSYYCAFDRAGRLATTCDDLLVRLYAPNENGAYRLLRRAEAPRGREPFGVTFSPDGERLALGHYDAIAVSVLSSPDLTEIFAPDVSGLDEDPSVEADLSVVTWSADGRFVYAAGSYPAEDRSEILRWSEAGRGARTALVAALNDVTDLKPWGPAGALFAAGDPRFGGFDGNGEKILDSGPETADMRGKLRKAFTVSSDGRSVRFGLGQGGSEPVRFDLDRRQVTVEAPVDAALTAARTEAPGVALEDWEDTTEPKLNGKTLALREDEVARSAAIAPGDEHVLLGAQWWLRLFKRTGEQAWDREVEVPDEAWGVNIPASGRLAIAACGDGTVRWYRLDTGDELLALFVHRDGQRWIAWTPQGYYDAAAGADDLIGWHVNRDRNQAAEFLPVWQFRERFCRPDVIARVLDILDVPQALHLAGEAADQKTGVADARVLLRESPPPTIELLSPRDGTAFEAHEVSLTYLLRDRTGAPRGPVVALIDDRPVEVSPRVRQRTLGAEVYEVPLWLPPRDVSVAIEVRGGDVSTRSAAIRLYWHGPAPQPRPTLYLLAVGVSKYRSFSPPLQYAHLDASDFASAMCRQEGLLYEKVHVRTLPDEEATREEIMLGFQWLAESSTTADVTIVFLSGHGLTARKGGYYFLPYDFELSKLWPTGIRQQDLAELLSQIDARKTLVFVDSCHAGAAAAGPLPASVQAHVERYVDIDRVANDLHHAVGIGVITSSSGTQDSIEHSDWKNGAFTEALLEGLAGEAEYGEQDRIITIAELILYVGKRVKKLTGDRQLPRMAGSWTDFAIARLPDGSPH